MKKIILSMLFFIAVIFVFSANIFAKEEIEVKNQKQLEDIAIDSGSAQESLPSGDAEPEATLMATTTTSGGQPYQSTEKFQVEPSTGTASVNIPIEVPAGRRGIQPNISLMYNSSSPNGILGVGWNLELGSIQRSTKRGVPTYNDSQDTFVLTQSGSSQELVPIGGNQYRAKIEGAYMKFEYLGPSNGWIVTDKKGIKYYFGQPTNSQQSDSNGKIFKWCLDRVEDLNGNYMTIIYSHNQRQLYPYHIYYTGNSITGESSFADIGFSWDERGDIAISYRSGFAITTAWRCNQIDVKIAGQLQRSYKLNYTYSSSTSRSLLTSITQYGADGVTSLPATTFSYQETQKGWQRDTGYGASESYTNEASFGFWNGNINADRGVRLADVNNDGFVDIPKKVEWDGWVNKIYINNKNENWSQGDWNFPSTSAFVWHAPEINRDRGLRFGDVNGDGWVDLIRNWERDPYNGGGFIKQTFLNNKTNGWYQNDSWLMPDNTQFVSQRGYPVYEYAEYRGVVFNDINGDGFQDIVKSQGSDRRTYLNNGVNGGTGWTRNSNWDLPSGADLTDGANLVDLNGDGVDDIVVSKGSGNYKAWLNRGPGWIDYPTYYPPEGNARDGDTQFADINSDGLPDLLIASDSSTKTYINTGNGWQRDSSWDMPDGNFKNYGTRMGDANADGLIDIIKYWANDNELRVYLNKGPYPDILSSIDNGIGATTEINYLPSTQYDNTGSDNISDLPFPIQTVSSVTATDQVSGQSYTTNYEYRDGLFDFEDREFRGFGFVKVSDAQGNYSETEFLQDDIYKGRVKEGRSFDASGNLYTKSTSDWQSQDLGNGSKFVYLNRADSYLYNGDPSYKHTATEYQYDAYGNPTKVSELGDVSQTGDERYGYTEYVYNDIDWLVGLPKNTYLKDSSDSNILKQTWFYYDGHSGLTEPPTKGLLTKQEDWFNGGTNPFATFTYDVYGHLLTTTDALGRSSSVIYDMDYHIFSLTATNALGHQVINEYYGVNGVALDDGAYRGLWGQLKSTTDPNNHAGFTIYDTFGRVEKQISPEDSVEYPTSQAEYHLDSVPIKIISHQREISDQEGTLDSVSFYDGLGRLVQTKTESEEPNKFIVSGQTEYDSRGLPYKKYLPKFSTNPIDSIDAIDPTDPHSTVTYDAMGRVIQSTSPDGTYSSVQYDDWVTTTIDENGHKQKSYFDAYGRLVRKEEYTGADGRSPNYPASPYALYATTLYSYDTLGNLVQTKDAHNNIVTIDYDSLGRKIAMDDPDMGVWSYQYDAAGNLISQTDAKGKVTNFVYDNINRLLQKSFSDGSLPVNYTYDDVAVPNSKGRLTKANYQLNANTNFEYDDLGREVKSTKKIENANYEVQRTYDAAGRLLSVQYPDGDEVFYSYNRGGQIESVSGSPIATDYQTKLLLHADGNDGSTSFVDSSSSSHMVSSLGASQIDTSEYKFGNASGLFFMLTGDDDYTKLLLHMNGNDGSTNFIDEKGKAVIVHGNAQLDTAQKKFGASSGLFDGNGDYLSVADSDDWRFGTDDFSIDFWVKFNDISSQKGLIGQITSGYVFWNLTWTPGVGLTLYANSGGNNWVDYRCAFSPSIDAWYHIAVVRDAEVGSENYHFFINGVEQTLSHQGRGIDAGNPFSFPDCSGPLTIGFEDDNDFIHNGWMDEIRISKGIARWTSNFTPPEIEYGNSNSYLTIPDSPDWNFGSSDFTIDLWIKMISTPPQGPGYCYALVNTFEGGWDYRTFGIDYNEITGKYKMYFNIYVNQVPTHIESDIETAIDINTWHHLAVVRNGNYWKFFVNGTQIGSTIENDINIPDVNGALVIGKRGDNNFFFNGWMDEIRISKGIARWTSNFTVPSAPYAIESGGEGNYYVENVDYNASGQITRIEYGNGNVTEYTYNPLNLRLTHLVTNSPTAGTIQDLSYQYDSVGNILRIIDNVNTGSQTFQYDELSRLVVASGGYGTKYFDYDEIGNMTLKDGVIYSYGAGSAGPHALTSGSDGSVFTYDANGNMASMTDSQLKTTNYIYDAENRLKSVKINNQTKASFVYDGDGGRTKKTLYKYSGGGGCFLAGTPILMSDGSTKPIEKVKVGDEVLSFDEEKNLLVADTVKQAFIHKTSEYFILNGTLRVTGEHPFYSAGEWIKVKDLKVGDSLRGSQGSPIEITSIEKVSLNADSRGLLAHPDIGVSGTRVSGNQDIRDNVPDLQITKSPSSGSLDDQIPSHNVLVYNLEVNPYHTYFAGGFLVHNKRQPVMPVEQNPGGGDYSLLKDKNTEKLRYVFEFLSSLLDPPVAEAATVTEIPTIFVGSLYEKTSGSPTKHIFLGSQRIASITNSQINYYHTDHLGSTNVITNEAGSQIALYEYKPYGEFSRKEEASADPTEYFFTGKKLDDETGLYFYGARYYNPTIGRFISPDTIVQSPGNPQTLNRYSYAGNNPINNVDPSGHSWKSFWKSLVGGIIGAVVGVLSGQPWLGFSAYNAFMAAMNGGNIGAALAGAVVGYFGGGIIGNAFGNFWGTIGAGVLGGASGAAIGGGDIGLAALSGFAGGITGYGVGALTKFAGLGTIIGGGVASEVAGGDFAEGALGGLAYNIGFTIGSTFAPMSSVATDSGSVGEGDPVFYSGEKIGGRFSLFSIGMAVLDPGPFNHTDIGLGGGKVAGSHPGMGVSNDGPDIRDMKSFPAYSKEKFVSIRGNQAIAKAANSLVTDMKTKGVTFRYLEKSPAIFSNSGNTVYCSQFTSQVYRNSGNTGVYGAGPNSQYWYLKK
ncbi:MAG: hypothetical protein FJZ10_01070 [Candidatus Omnitrophica bacterium]|nr:hypothetical protein [Candidatus Omnitrophota bacterium]